MNPLQFAMRIAVAVALGALIGMERQLRQRRAGLRTNALVATGAAAFVALAAMAARDSSPTRIAAAVVSGIGFLGAGVIMREGLSVQGLNTAATLWCSAAVGVLAGSGFPGAAAITTGMVIAANVLLRPLGRLVDRQPAAASEVEVHYCVKAVCGAQDEHHVRTLLLQAVAREALMLRALRSEDTANPPNVNVHADLLTDGRGDRIIEQVCSRLSMEPGVTAVSWEILADDREDHPFVRVPDRPSEGGR
jgi:putative Mg2+ transporter-C (MgtC) family protein